MKKMVLVAAATLGFAFLFTSCSKKGDYTCECTFTAAGQTQTSVSPFLDVKKKDAKKNCQAMEDTYNLNSQGLGSAKCILK